MPPLDSSFTFLITFATIFAPLNKTITRIQIQIKREKDMFTEITEDTISATDSCQMETTGTTLKVSPATQPTNQVTSETYTVIPPRRTFNEQKPFVFSIIGFAVFYIIALIVGRVIKMRLPHHS